VTQVNHIDVLFIGAGPASLSGAIELQRSLNEAGRTERVAVIEKSDKVGQHILSGLVFEPEVLDELIPDWRESKDPFVTRALANDVRYDEVRLLLGRSIALRVPKAVVPSYLKHHGNLILSGSDMARWLAKEAQDLGVKIYTGFAATEVLYDGDRVRGVKLGEKGRSRDGEKQVNYVPAEIVEAKVTVFGEGSLGRLAEDVVERQDLHRIGNPQIYSLGVKEIIKLPDDNAFGVNHVVHTFGYPLTTVFGGGTIYSLDKNTVAVALILALDWKYADLNPQLELQVFKSHKYVRSLLEGGEVISYGAKTLPEGGYWALPQPYTNGALIVGDAAGFTDVRKLKGWHNAMWSGLLAGRAIRAAIESDDFGADSLGLYGQLLEQSPVMEDLRKGKNYRQVFSKSGSVLLGAPLSLFQGIIRRRLNTPPDYETLRAARLDRDFHGGQDRLTDVALSGTIHREEEPSHITITDPELCNECYEMFGAYPCVYFCPGEVYEVHDGRLVVNYSNCLHCQTCRAKCPHQVVQWHVPEGGEGPKYKAM
jgi:electron-transferring-flavoprotein dehydrogenase